MFGFVDDPIQRRETVTTALQSKPHSFSATVTQGYPGSLACNGSQWVDRRLNG
jgi:hypothetical protein